jgi:hypothetical protein
MIVFFLQNDTYLELKYHDFTIILLQLFYKFVTMGKTSGNYGINLIGKGRCE